MEVVLLIECEIPLLKLVVELLPNMNAEEERLIYLDGKTLVSVPQSVIEEPCLMNQ